MLETAVSLFERWRSKSHIFPPNEALRALCTRLSTGNTGQASAPWWGRCHHMWTSNFSEVFHSGLSRVIACLNQQVSPSTGCLHHTPQKRHGLTPSSKHTSVRGTFYCHLFEVKVQCVIPASRGPTVTTLKRQTAKWGGGVEWNHVIFFFWLTRLKSFWHDPGENMLRWGNVFRFHSRFSTWNGSLPDMKLIHLE